jgi:hypothetical protein
MKRDENMDYQVENYGIAGKPYEAPAWSKGVWGQGKPVDPFLGQIKPLQEVSELKRRGDIKREEAKRFFQSLD